MNCSANDIVSKSSQRSYVKDGHQIDKGPWQSAMQYVQCALDVVCVFFNCVSILLENIVEKLKMNINHKYIDANVLPV